MHVGPGGLVMIDLGLRVLVWCGLGWVACRGRPAVMPEMPENGAEVVSGLCFFQPAALFGPPNSAVRQHPNRCRPSSVGPMGPSTTPWPESQPVSPESLGDSLLFAAGRVLYRRRNVLYSFDMEYRSLTVNYPCSDAAYNACCPFWVILFLSPFFSFVFFFLKALRVLWLTSIGFIVVILFLLFHQIFQGIRFIVRLPMTNFSWLYFLKKFHSALMSEYSSFCRMTKRWTISRKETISEMRQEA